MPDINIKPNIQDFRFTEALLIFLPWLASYIEFEDEFYRIVVIIVAATCALAYVITKNAKDRHVENKLKGSE